jgi:hypothetical protein
MSAKPAAARPTGSGIPHEADRKYDGADCPALLEPGQKPPTPGLVRRLDLDHQRATGPGVPLTGTVASVRLRGWKVSVAAAVAP